MALCVLRTARGVAHNWAPFARDQGVRPASDWGGAAHCDRVWENNEIELTESQWWRPCMGVGGVGKTKEGVKRQGLCGFRSEQLCGSNKRWYCEEAPYQRDAVFIRTTVYPVRKGGGGVPPTLPLSSASAASPSAPFGFYNIKMLLFKTAYSVLISLNSFSSREAALIRG